ncbi:Crp/Fnr family transcriptional regulator [Hathewaya limosa]|uniref:CRP-like cAMP-binding protein n=1 Tax=Hathewaya limosa TaxID=1536 RepID=A0ABU0JRB2_HATLI|nr:Crp/Fnr family transcriptional regulator [Hathewaya limosa]MDQ0478718.1 CRP-like cAMP-binding protein [Hathewaya limosa]
MINIVNCLSQCMLFKGLQKEEIRSMMDKINFTKHNYSKGEVVVLEGDDISSIGIITEGELEMQKSYPSGKKILISKINKFGIFGEINIFSNMESYTSSIISVTESEVIFIEKKEILKLCKVNEIFLNRLMMLLSDKILVLNKRLKELSYATIREKLADFILEEYKRQEKLIIDVRQKRNDMAEYFGVTRPSVSRELIKMKLEGLIDFNKKTITIKNLEKLEDILV